MRPNSLDARILQVGIEVNGRVKIYQDLAIKASGTKYANANQNECEISIANLDRETRNFILTETSPFNKNKTPKKVYLKAGRQSYGAFLLFSGDVVTATPSQPSDIWLTLRCLTGNYQKGNIIARNQPGVSKLSTISQQVAKDLGVSLNFQAQDQQISNYNFTGGALNQVSKLGDLGAVNAYIDNDELVVKDLNIPLTGTLQIISLETGMIGVPEITEQGIRVKFLISPKTTLGGMLRIASVINPAANGDYVIYKLSFEVTNRDTPFYWIAEGKRL